MALHELKTWPAYFDAVLSGRKTFEVRKADRNFNVGDVLMLLEWDNERKSYTGRHIGKFVSYVMRGGQFGVAPDHVVMGLSNEQ